MCGIFASYNPQHPCSLEEAGKALAALRSRGRDGRGFYQSENKHCLLAHNRLAIHGDTAQPLKLDGLALVVNGEFYNVDELCRRFHFQLRTDSDSEVLLHLYQRFGLDAITYLDGEFAFVLWDGPRQRLVAGRDPFGVKPLLFATEPGGIRLASQAKALFAAGHRAAWSEAGLSAMLTQQYPLPGQTLFAGIEEVKPGRQLIFENGCPHQYAYKLEVETSPLEDPAEAQTALYEALHQAVGKRATHGDHLPVCCLSGGLDSSAVSLIAAEFGVKEAYTVSFQDHLYDEANAAAETARALGLHLNVVSLDADQLFDDLQDAVYCSEGTAVNAHLPAKFRLFRTIAEQGSRVVLTGEGSDELFAGYPHFVAEYQRNPSRIDPLRYPTCQGIMGNNELGENHSFESVDLPGFVRVKMDNARQIRTFLNPDFLACYDPTHTLNYHQQQALRFGSDLLRRATSTWLDSALPQYILKTLGDGCETASTIEGRTPFLDRHVAAVAARIPDQLKIHDGIEKWILRRALSGRLPEVVVQTAKQPFFAPPLYAWSNDKTRRRIRERLESGSSREWLDQKRIQCLFKELEDNDPVLQRKRDPILMSLLSLAFIDEAFFKTNQKSHDQRRSHVSA